MLIDPTKGFFAVVEHDATMRGELDQQQPEPRVFGQRFQQRRLLKRGRILETLYGVDLQDGTPVVIKTLPTASIPAGIRMRLEHDAETMRRVDNPLIAPLLSVGHTADVFYLVSRYQAGQTLDSLLSERRLSVDETLEVARCLLSALEAAHALGVLHRDIKPANVIMAADAAGLQPVLVDFGFAHSSQLDVASGDQPLSSLRYMSPEQAGLLDVDLGPCSDLYSVGAVLYECLAGRPPFIGQTIGELLQQHMTAQPGALSTRGLELPDVLDELIQRLLRKDPRDRYQRAAGALADIDAIREAWSRGQRQPALVIGLHDQRRTLTEPAFVGRDEQLATLARQVNRVREGRCGLALVEAESGGGKTRLLSEVAARCSAHAVWVLRGRALDRIGQKPFQTLDGVCDDIVAAARSEPRLAAALRRHVGQHRSAIVAVLPKLGEVLGRERPERAGPEAFGETRTVEALVTLLRHLGSKQRPAVVFLDDCQWADEATLKLLERWQTQQRLRRPTACHAMLVAAFRKEEVHDGHLLRNLKPTEHLVLPPLEQETIRQLVESMAGKLPREALEVIERLSSGSPFMASAVLRGMTESRALIAGVKGWRVERSAMDDVRSSQHAAELLVRRIEMLPVVATDLLKVAAVLGKEFDLNLAANLAGLLPRTAVVALRQVQNRHLVWTRPEDEKCSFVHDKVRETCLSLLTEDEQRKLHLRAAALLEQETPLPVFDLAYHYDVAGQSERALEYALEAAEQARAQYALEIAEQQYRIAIRGTLHASQRVRYQIAEGLGDVLMLRGRYDGARQMFEVAKFLAEGDVYVVKAKIEGKIGELAFKRGDMQAAVAALKRALGYLKLRVPDKFTAFLLLMIWEVCVQALHRLLPRLFVQRRTLENAQKDLLAAHLYGRLGHAYWFSRGPIPTLWTHYRILNLTERYPPTRELAQAYSQHAPAMSLIGRYRSGILYAEKSLKIRRDLDDVWGQAQSLHYHGIVLYAASRFEECIEKCREAVRLFERTGDYWEMHIARYQIAASLYRMGDLSGALTEAKRLHKSGVERGDAQASGISLDVWAWASEGRVPAEILQSERTRKRTDKQAIAQVSVAEAVCLLHEGRTQQAVNVLEQARVTLLQRGIANAWVSPVLPWLATALRQQVEEVAVYAPQTRQMLMRRAERAANSAIRLARRFRNDLPHALREKALLLAMQGKGRKASRYFDRSINEAHEQGAHYERALSRLWRGRVGLELGWRDADRDVAEAQSQIARLHADFDSSDEDSSDSLTIPVTLSLVDRFDTVLDAGRRIASALNRDQIYLEVQDAALRLLRGESCSIIRITSAQPPADNVNPPRDATTNAEQPSRVDGESSAPTDHGRDGSEELSGHGTLVAAALREKRTVVYSAATDEGHLADGVAVEARSAICTPVFVRGQATACFYVVHRRVAGLFGEDEQRLAEFIAAIAGAALENAAGFEELRELNATLEHRVRQRTADLEARQAELARSNHELEQFAYVASHDLQEPLRTVTSYCKLLMQRRADDLDEKSREYVEQAVDAAGRMRTLINDLLAYSRVGRMGKPFQPADCNAVVDQAVANLSLRIEETAATVTRGELPVVTGDPTQLLQLFQNLIGNALKFRGSGRPEVHIEAERQNGDWLFSVRDNGIGIAAEDYERIFMIFQRLHSRDKYTGTGIGLAVCKKTVEQHGGRIWVESTPGQGSTFRFTLGRSQAESPPETPANQWDSSQNSEHSRDGLS
jgi:two-component system sensor kinase